MKKSYVILLVTAIFLLIIGSLIYQGYLWPNNIFATQYHIQGIDVSHYQNNIDWKEIVKDETIKFAFIKATEGKDYRDDYFTTNWEAASKVSLYKGAYHYFTITNSGVEQARNFITTVPIEKGCLPLKYSKA